MERFSPHFTVSELQDPTTKRIILAEGFIDELEDLRVAYGHPMVVTSCCRSSEHNKWLKSRGYPASPNSLHLMDNRKYGTETHAIDIKRPSPVLLRKLILDALNRGWTVRLAEAFVHLDLRGKYAGLEPHFDTY